MKAYELDPELYPRREILVEYEKVGKLDEYDRTVHDRVYAWFISKVQSEPVKNQEITQKITALQREKTDDGKEWLVYHLTYYGRDWEDNPVDFYQVEGKIEGIPIWRQKKDPYTGTVSSIEKEGLETKYTIPFSKEQVEKLEKYFTRPLSCSIKEPETGRRYSCSLEELKNLPYQQLVNDKTQMTEWYKMKNRGEGVYK